MKKYHVQLADQDKHQIKEVLSKGAIKSRVSRRLTALLMLNEHKTIGEVALVLKVRRDTVADWKRRYNEEGLEFLLTEKPRSGRPVEIDGKSRAKITALACSEPPEGYSRWTLRLLSDKIVELGYVEEISHSYVQEVLKKMS